jgi:F420H(2)-dependent quinone reductase
MTPKDAFYKVGTGIHRAIFNVSKGRIFGKSFGMPLIELVTTGRRSGKERATMLSVPIIDGDRLVLVASFGAMTGTRHGISTSKSTQRYALRSQARLAP